MYYARIGIVTTTSTVAAATGTDPKTCYTFQAPLRLFENAASSQPASLMLRTIAGELISVTNTLEKEFPPGTDLIVAETVQERWIILDGSPPTGAIRFKIPEAYDGKRLANWFFIVATLNSSEPGEPAGPPINEFSTIIHHSHAFDVESVPFGSGYHRHLWIVEWCALPTDDLENGYVQTFNESWIPGWITSATLMPATTDAKLQTIDEQLRAPAAYETETFLDIEAPGCDPKLCIDGTLPEKIPGSKTRAMVLSRPCGVEKVSGEDDEGFVEIVDNMEGSFLGGRDAEDWAGHEGIAIYVYDVDDAEATCYWLITWIDWFEPEQRVKDVVYGSRSITVQRVIDDVWRTCDLPDEVIIAADCDETYPA